MQTFQVRNPALKTLQLEHIQLCKLHVPEMLSKPKYEFKHLPLRNIQIALTHLKQIEISIVLSAV